jgi:MFS family permease
VETEAGTTTGLTPGRRWLILLICCMSVFVVGIDVTIINVALPSIRQGLHASVTDLQWTIDAYTLVLACLLMLSGSLADRLGRRRVFHARLAQRAEETADDQSVTAAR